MIKNPIAQHCGNCIFADLGRTIDRDIYGTPSNGRAIVMCRRYPSGLTTRRKTFAVDWCGEYSRSLARTLRPIREPK